MRSDVAIGRRMNGREMFIAHSHPVKETSIFG
jgi:hypothetical protein